MYQCGLPKEMALELFKPLVMKSGFNVKLQLTLKMRRVKIERMDDEVWDIGRSN